MSAIRDFIISTTFPTILIPLFTVVVIVIDLINPQNPIPPIIVAITLVVLIVWAILRWSLDHNLRLIKEYSSLMHFLENLDTIDGEITILNVSNKSDIKHPCWRHYFKEKGQDLNNTFNDLYYKLNKIIHNPYMLLNKRLMDDVRWRFNNLVWSNYQLYLKFIEMVDDQNIHKSTFGYDKIKKAYEEFFSALKNSRAKFVEIYNDHDSTCEFFNPLREPKQ